MITLKIDVTKIDKSRLFKGEKGTYVDLVLIETPNGQYGDYMVKQSVTKAEREAKVQMPIIGNGKIIGGRPASRVEQPKESDSPKPESDDVPF